MDKWDVHLSSGRRPLTFGCILVFQFLVQNYSPSPAGDHLPGQFLLFADSLSTAQSLHSTYWSHPPNYTWAVHELPLAFKWGFKITLMPSYVGISDSGAASATRDYTCLGTHLPVTLLYFGQMGKRME
jgi:hypothetical protein